MRFQEFTLGRQHWGINFIFQNVLNKPAEYLKILHTRSVKQYDTENMYHSSDKKLIRRWDSERELSLRRHCTHTIENTIDPSINSATDRFLQRRFTKFSEITQQRPWRRSRSFNVTGFGTNRKLIYDFLLLINTNLSPILHRFQVMADYLSNFRSRWGWSPANIAINDIAKTRLHGLHFRCRKYWCIFNHFYVIRHETYRIWWNYPAVVAITPFKVI